MNCKKCKERLAETDLFCTHCGFFIDKKSKLNKINFFKFLKKIDLSNFIKSISKNWFKFSLILCLIILIIVGFFIFKNGQERKHQMEIDKINYQKQTDCRNIVSKIKDNLKEEKENDYILFWDYRYNKTTQRCILGYQITNIFFDTNLGTSYVIEDAFTNEELFKNPGRVSTAKNSDKVDKDFYEEIDFYFNEK
ncbi:MAG: hypothetical protein UR25_C0004G0105 [Candidatus Nomurabacteria bacterium GW2011_GWE1_32_28]|uniref:Zinc-ribbon domain-containing protein n=1 Tax=Candidatus Nomurabacteria bacterium GW2011_GWF1_31_48 TaxID=1618767 RepID=A0A0G0AUC1_9BACT|nr:MAG: hypothetical protein UR10_C0004G0105 [Candidatus Nomurabacteria bacterium GW2011_GWF2_30_133]KKP28639.1 MAG: hypothetical protein UR18_C0002G0051 [Candidatus Nomurabacteria bacterium GW2011_GWE2_31_40]KKP30215.1 MAG: hypothetical protein UR19_C0003G0051 [Candidatus Nomurabacteria bacterium GW2011_GWF1_31_48]KKP34741.1 MAG: hypothetical protein UR25_C0004G0105 [Candidatus Nomurabacteria bacterium GW2011_GWE1_32_28]HAS80801.1 hypothetical protein [Candidatus Nomurabacteria bacterium]